MKTGGEEVSQEERKGREEEGKGTTRKRPRTRREDTEGRHDKLSSDRKMEGAEMLSKEFRKTQVDGIAQKTNSSDMYRHRFR